MSDNTNVKVNIDGKNFEFVMGRNDNVLDSALSEDIDLPYSCQSGVCTACQGKLVSGTVEMEVTDGLSDEEMDEGYILCCQAQPTSDDLEIDIE
tara:strand:+ start:1217 stop:1498 length:282 start_codon:yes stop_codon:yes gene_type:complete